MDDEKSTLFTVAEAAAAWGVSTQAIYQRLQRLQRLGFVVAKGKKRYITREGVEAQQQEYKQLAKEVDKGLPTLQEEFATLQTENERLKGELLAEQAKTSTLQATVTAQEAHIETLKQALDREQSLHMAALQQRLPAGRGGGFFAWLRGKKTE